jgi:pyruvate/2-oxoglutarate dehydrogenase complex dihydrolipoamide acyltransferase (E2) component
MKWKRQDIIDAIVKMRIDKGASTKTILNDFLMGELNYKISYSYSLMAEAREQIIELYQTTNKSLANEALGQLESLYEDAIKDKNKKLALEIRKEINKLTGVYAAEKVQVSGLENLTIEIVNSKKDENKGN